MGCLQQWFNKSNAANEEIHGVVPVVRRKKTCPHCRTPVVQRPVVAHLLKALTTEVLTGWAALTARTPPVEGALVQGDPWKDIFPSERNGANRGADGAIIDYEDGGVRRCVNCLTEIYQGVCEGCGEVYDVEDYLSDESLEFDYPPYPAQLLRPLPYRDGFIVDDDPPPQRWREVYDDEEDGELDEYEADFINDGDVEHVEDEDDGSHSEDPRRGRVRFETPPHARNRYNGVIVVADSEPDEEEEEEEEEINLQPAFNRRRVPATIVISDDEESVVCDYESSHSYSNKCLYYSKTYSPRTKVRLQPGGPCTNSIDTVCWKNIPRRRMKIQCRLSDSCSLGRSIPLSIIKCKPLLNVGCVKKYYRLLKRSFSGDFVMSTMTIRTSTRIHKLKRKPGLILRTKRNRESYVPWPGCCD